MAYEIFFVRSSGDAPQPHQAMGIRSPHTEIPLPSMLATSPQYPIV
jgi:hypothetical protein